MIHELKTDPMVFEALVNGDKTFEIRKNDRGFEVGDVLELRETQYTGADIATGAPLVYTGRSIAVVVDYILHGPVYGLAEGWVIMSVSGL